MRLVARIGLVASGFVACSNGANRTTHEKEESFGAIASAIQNGIADTTHVFAVGVCGGARGACSLECSGVLIAPNLVVTARHCVEVSNDATVVCATSQFAQAIEPPSFFAITTNASMHQAGSGWHAVSQVMTPGIAASAVCGDDIALLILSDVIAPSEAVPATPNVATPFTDESVFEPVETAIGYGLSAGRPSPTPPGYVDTSGVRRAKTDVPVLCIADATDPALACSADTLTRIGANEMVTGDATCQGDSGSGAFAQLQFDAGQFVVVGVLSRGSIDPTDATRCQSGIYTRLDRWSDFLVREAQAAAQFGGYATPLWAIELDAASPPDASDAPPPVAAVPSPANPVPTVIGGCVMGRAAAPAAGPAWFATALLTAAALVVRARLRRRF